MNKRAMQGMGPGDLPVPLQFSIPSPFPEYLVRELEKRYENVFCTVARLSDASVKGEAAAYIAFGSEEPSTIVLYRRKGRVLTVLNEYACLTCRELERMACHLFNEHPDVDVISLGSVAWEDKRLSFPAQCFNSTEDIVIFLPETIERYLSALGPNTRAAVRKSQKSIVASKPAIDFAFYDKGDVGTERIEQLIELSRLRITSKNQAPRHSEASIAQLWKMVESYGVTLVAQIEGKVVGGVICTHLGSRVYMHVITHDSMFDGVRLGLLCCYLSICECIRRGAREYHLLSGTYDYKYRLLGVQRDYDRIIIYRSLGRVLSNISLFLHTSIRGHGRKTKQRLVIWRKKWTRLTSR